MEKGGVENKEKGNYNLSLVLEKVPSQIHMVDVVGGRILG